jgi:hypothetical protein
MEALLFSLGAPVVKSFTGIYTLKQQLIFLGVMTLYTLVFLLYRCKSKTEADKEGKKPNVKLSKLFLAMLPLIIYVAVLFGLGTALQYSINPYILAGYSIGSTVIVTWLVSLLLYYPAVKLSHPDCFPSMLKGFLNFLKSLIPGLK